LREQQATSLAQKPRPRRAQLAAAGQALARALPAGRLEDACHALAGLHALTAGPLPRPVVLALPRPRLPASEAVRAPQLDPPGRGAACRGARWSKFCCVRCWLPGPDAELQAAYASPYGSLTECHHGQPGETAVSLSHTSTNEDLQAGIAGRRPQNPPLTLGGSESVAHCVHRHQCVW